MRVVLDTNVVISGIFFSGTPAKLMAAWREGRFSLVVSPLILDEYRRVAAELSTAYPTVEITQIFDLVTVHSEIVEDRPFESPICRDLDDDKFLACAAVAGAQLVSGDKDLLAADGMAGVRVYSPRAFAAAFLA